MVGRSTSIASVWFTRFLPLLLRWYIYPDSKKYGSDNHDDELHNIATAATANDNNNKKRRQQNYWCYGRKRNIITIIDMIYRLRCCCFTLTFVDPNLSTTEKKLIHIFRCSWHVLWLATVNDKMGVAMMEEGKLYTKASYQLPRQLNCDTQSVAEQL